MTDVFTADIHLVGKDPIKLKHLMQKLVRFANAQDPDPELDLSISADLPTIVHSKGSCRRGFYARIGRSEPQPLMPNEAIKLVVSIGLSNGTVRILRENGIVNLGDLVARTTGDLMSIPHLGRVKYNEIKSCLDLHGLKLVREANYSTTDTVWLCTTH